MWPFVWRRRDACVWCSTSIIDVPVLAVTERSSLYAQRRDKSEPLNVTRDARHVPVERTVSSNSIFISAFQISHGRMAHCVSLHECTWSFFWSPPFSVIHHARSPRLLQMFPRSRRSCRSPVAARNAPPT